MIQCNSERRYLPSCDLCCSTCYRPTYTFSKNSKRFEKPPVNNSPKFRRTHRVKDAPISPYLAEFRTRPAMERRAASIHVHVDGDKGPSIADVSSVCLHALFSLLGHVNGSQLGFIMRASFDSLDDLNGWRSLQHCCWFAQKTAEWSQYQYRYAVPTWLVERLLEGQDTAVSAPTHKALVTMATAVFNSPIPLINLSTSDIISNLITLLIRRISSDTDDIVLPALVECMSSLGRHVYYSDQIQDLAVCFIVEFS